MQPPSGIKIDQKRELSIDQTQHRYVQNNVKSARSVRSPLSSIWSWETRKISFQIGQDGTWLERSTVSLVALIRFAEQWRGMKSLW